MSLTIKICGLSTEETVDAAIDAGADMIGFVLFPASPRYVSPQRASELARHARGRAEVAMLTVDMDPAALADAAGEVKPDWLQLHGREAPEILSQIRAMQGRRIIKALGVAASADLDAASAYADVADRLLLDAKPPKGASRPGGNGESFDWSILAGFRPALPYMLSGGLDAGNVAEALRSSAAIGVDVSSGVESAPGHKDVGLIRAFIETARKAERDSAARTIEKAAS